MPHAEDIQAVVHEDVTFLDLGENFEDVRCPSCKKSVDQNWWREAMDAAGQKGFADLNVRVPCCRSKTSLNDLDYRWPAGFARFVLEVSEPHLAEPLDREALSQVEGVLGQPVRQILARY